MKKYVICCIDSKLLGTIQKFFKCGGKNECVWPVRERNPILTAPIAMSFTSTSIYQWTNAINISRYK